MCREGIPIGNNSTGEKALVSFGLSVQWENLKSVTTGTRVWRHGEQISRFYGRQVMKYLIL